MPVKKKNPVVKIPVDNKKITNKINTASPTKISEIDLLKAKSLLCQKSFYYFFKEFWDEVILEEFKDNWHIKYLCDILQEVGFKLRDRRQKDKDIIINVPPGTSKSTIVSILFPCWLWTIDDSLRIISGTYSGALSTEQAVKSRTVIQSEKYKSYFPWVQLKDDESGKTNYKTNRSGARYAVSTTSMVTGLHAHLLLIDDPQNPELANSEPERERTNNWITSTMSTRKADKEVTVTIIVQQRLHQLDVTGYLLSKQKKYQHICLPAIISDKVYPKELKENYVDGLLDPKRLSMDSLNELKGDMGTKSFNTQVLQAPENNETSILKEQWLKIISRYDYNILKDQAEKDKQNPTTHYFLDSAYTDDTNNDPSAIISTVKINEQLYITDIVQVWMEFTQLITHIKYFTDKTGYNDKKSKIYIEPKASGKSIFQFLKTQTSLNVIEFPSPRGSKLERLSAISPKVEGGKVMIVEGAWNRKFIDEITTNYPIHDDLRDVFIMAVQLNLMKSKSYGRYSFGTV